MDKYLAKSFSALGDPTRLAVIEALLNGPATVTELAEPFSMHLPPFTKHLKTLEEAGLIKSVKRGRVRTCSINIDSMAELNHWFQQRRALWEHKLDHLDRHLAGKRTKKD